MGATRFEEVEVWKKAHVWVLAIYRFSALFPKHELFGLTSQLRKAAVSVPANFAEGFKRLGRGDKVRFYNISQASLEECRYYLILSRDLGYGQTDVLMATVDEVARMLASYIQAILGRR
jgi:four helix bundle protein